MKQSMIYMQTLAGQTGLPLRKVEAAMKEILDTYLDFELPAERAGREDDRASWESFRFGQRNVLAFLDGEYETIDGCLEALIDERKENGHAG